MPSKNSKPNPAPKLPKGTLPATPVPPDAPTCPYKAGAFHVGDSKPPRVWFDAVDNADGTFTLHAQLEGEKDVREFAYAPALDGKAAKIAAASMVDAAFDHLIKAGVVLEEPAIIAKDHPFALHVAVLVDGDAEAPEPTVNPPLF